MKTKWWMTSVLLALTVSLPLSLISCGGGGGGGISYNGVTTQAQVTEENATPLAVGAWLGGSLGPNIDIFGAVVSDGEIFNNSFSLGVMPGVFMNLMDDLVIPPFTGGGYAGAVQQINERMYGSCGGTADITGSADDETGSFSGSVNFEDFCEDTFITKGRADVSGTVDLVSEEVVRFTLTFKSLTLEDAQESMTIKGSFSADYTASPFEVTMSYVIRNNDQMKTYWMKDATFQLVGEMDYVDITSATGRYYDPDYGYVELSVGTTIRIYDYGYWPSNGTLILTGAQGTSGGSSKARLVFLNSNSYQVEADTNGDGTNDYMDGPYNWTDEIALLDPYIFSENTAFSDFFIDAGLAGSYFMRALVKSDSPAHSMYIEGGPVYEQIPYAAGIDLLFAPYYSYMKAFMPPYDPPGASWEGIEYTFFADGNLNGLFDPGETYQVCTIPEEALRQLDIPVVTVTGNFSPTVSWQAVANADNYIINFFTLTPQNRLGTAVFTTTVEADGAPSYSYTYEGDLFNQYSQLAIAVVAREEVSACVLNRSLYYTVHSI